MKLSKLVLIAAMTVGGVCSAQAAPNTAAIAAKLQASALTTSAKLPAPPADTKSEVKAYVKSLSPAERAELIEQFADLTPKQQKAVAKWYKNLPASPT